MEWADLPSLEHLKCTRYNRLKGRQTGFDRDRREAWVTQDEITEASVLHVTSHSFPSVNLIPNAHARTFCTEALRLLVAQDPRMTRTRWVFPAWQGCVGKEMGALPARCCAKWLS